MSATILLYTRRHELRKETVDALRAVNRRFYQERASEFSRTREQPWKGWGEIFRRVETLLPKHPRVLDVGCGNGRFARFLEEGLGGDFEYCGVDESPLALAEAGRRLASREKTVLVEADFLEPTLSLPVHDLDLIALFGILHHVPGRENRVGLLKRLPALLAPRGLLTFSLWRFDRYPRFRKKIVPWEDFLAKSGVALDLDDLEPGDCILTWGGGPPAYRYCHAMTEEEEREIEGALSLEQVARFDAGEEPNRYYVLRYPQTA
jgi:tRNA (uracil-5-)-methyltransferase TRM9